VAANIVAVGTVPAEVFEIEQRRLHRAADVVDAFGPGPVALGWRPAGETLALAPVAAYGASSRSAGWPFWTDWL
jgi:hypothetical protein